MDPLGNYYAATADQPPPRPPLAGDIEAQVCVVGAGFAGLATALGLLERGARSVVVLEANTVGHGASGRNGGFVFGGYSLDCVDLLRQVGPEQARAAYGLTRDAVDLIRRRVRRYRIACDLVEGGALLVNWFDDDNRILFERQRLMSEHFGIRWEFIDKQRLDTMVRSKRYAGALREADAFHFQPLKYVRGEANAIESLGGRIFEQTGAEAVETGPRGMVVRTAAGSVLAEQVVIAGGGYLAGLAAELERAMLPIATYVMVTEPLHGTLAKCLPSRAAVYDTRFAFDYYRGLDDTRLLWGGRISIRDRSPADIAVFLRRDMLRVFPSLREARIEFAWSGLMSYARHKMPQIGRLPNGAWYALGFGGHGVAPTTAAGEILGDAVLGLAPIPALFSRYRLPRTLGPVGLGAAQLGYSWFQLRDWQRRANS